MPLFFITAISKLVLFSYCIISNVMQIDNKALRITKLKIFKDRMVSIRFIFQKPLLVTRNFILTAPFLNTLHVFSISSRWWFCHERQELHFLMEIFFEREQFCRPKNIKFESETGRLNFRKKVKFCLSLNSASGILSESRSNFEFLAYRH